MPTLSTWITGRKTVATPNSPEHLQEDEPCKVLFIKALADNSGTVYVASASTSGGSAIGIELAASETFTIEIDNLGKIFIDAATASDGVAWALLK